MQKQNKSIFQCCNNCNSPSVNQFKQVVNLKKSRLFIYVHDSDILQKQNIDDIKGSIILHNSGNKELKRYNYITEMCQYKTKCFKCREYIKRVRSLIDNITTINKNEVLGICQHCKRSPTKGKCKRCNYIVHRFLKNQVEECLENEKNFQEWLCRIRQILISVMQGEMICKHNVHLDTESKIELDKLLKYLNISSIRRQPEISISEMWDIENICCKNNKLLSQLLKEISSENIKTSHSLDNLSLSETSNCICKYLLNKRINKTFSHENSTIKKDFISITSLSTKHEENEKRNVNFECSTEKLVIKKQAQLSTKPKIITKAYTETIENTNIENFVKNKYLKNKISITKQVKNDNKEKQQNQVLNKQSLTAMIKHRQKVHLKESKIKIKNKQLLKIPEATLVKNLQKQIEIELENSESIMECKDEHLSHVSEMIIGNKVIPYRSQHDIEFMVKKLPIIFNTQVNLSFPTKDTMEPITYLNKTERRSDNIIKENVPVPNSGILMYQLSNREFINRGWTILPTTKIMRRMYTYKMIPSNSNNIWFYNLKQQKILFYDSGQKLAELYENGCGKWYYKNGYTALEYYATSDINLGKRCIIYNLGDEKDLQMKKSVSILACFDYHGNGIIYDSHCNIRLKYNQSEGLVIDKNIGPPGRWKWHTLNEPPILLPVFLNTYTNEEIYPQNLESKENLIKCNDEMTSIELEKLSKEKANEMLREYKPFQIRIKVLKISQYFSLRIVNQSKIHVQFNYERMHFKLNLGMLLKSNEIIGTDISDVSEVSTPYDNMQKQ